MFVSSYSTYTGTNIIDKTQKEKYLNASGEKQFRFAPQQTKSDSTSEPRYSPRVELPLNYVSDYKVLSNQQRLQQNTQTDQKEKNQELKRSTLQKAQSAYEENSTLFASMRKPKLTLSTMPLLNTSLPQSAYTAQEEILKHKMVNTYIANDNYYKITA